MPRMTEEEADALDDEITNADITLKPGKGGIFTQQRELLNILGPTTADYIMTRAMAEKKMPLEILNEVVYEKITASV